MEVLAGVREEQREADLRRLLLRFELLPFDAVTDFDAVVTIYRRCVERASPREACSTT